MGCGVWEGCGGGGGSEGGGWGGGGGGGGGSGSAPTLGGNSKRLFFSYMARKPHEFANVNNYNPVK